MLNNNYGINWDDDDKQSLKPAWDGCFEERVGSHHSSRVAVAGIGGSSRFSPQEDRRLRNQQPITSLLKHR